VSAPACGLPERIGLVLPGWVAGLAAAGRRVPGDDAKVALAVTLARANIDHGTGGPFGAAVFDQDDVLLAAGVNVVLPQTCSVAHAEMMAFMLAQQHTGRARLNDDGRRYTLATSAQPCCQCYGASIWAGIDTLLIGARSEDVMALTEFDEGPLPADWIAELDRRGIAVRRDLQRDAARAVLADYGQLGGARY
jgi:tRNA(Arg) A34 adenosine deaminase TadA